MRESQHESDSWVPLASLSRQNGRGAKRGGNRNTRVAKAWKPLPGHKSHTITLEEYKRTRGKDDAK